MPSSQDVHLWMEKGRYLMGELKPDLYAIKLVNGIYYKTFFCRPLSFVRIMNLTARLLDENPSYKLAAICIYDEWHQGKTSNEY